MGVATDVVVTGKNMCCILSANYIPCMQRAYMVLHSN